MRRRKVRRWQTFVLLAAWAPSLVVLAQPKAPTAPDSTKKPKVAKHHAKSAPFQPPETIMLPMRDGTRLATDVYLPKQGTRFPTIYSTGPYGKLGLANQAQAWIERGYAVVSQDMRGRFKSEGDPAIIFHHNGWVKNTDGHDTVRWIAKQPWSDGAVGTWGGSALGITQNLTAPFAPESLKAQWVVVAFSDMYTQGAYPGGVFRNELLEGWLKSQKLEEKNLATFIAHPNKDSFWADFDAEAQAKHVRCAGAFIGGWYDIFIQGTINSFVSIQHQGGPGARGNCRLYIGPIGHGFFTDLVYPNAGFPKEADPIRFYDRHLRGKANGALAEKPVHYYVMGDPTDKKAPGNYWRAAADWPPPADVTPFYLGADGGLAPERAATSAQKTFAYDPKNPVPTLGGQNLRIPLGPKDQRPVEGRPDVLLFTTPPLAEPLEVTGRIFAKLFISCDAPDTDFAVKLCDVYPDGRSMLVTDGILRARHRVSLAREDFLEPGQVYPLTVDLWSTSLIFAKGHRIRVSVTSSNWPRFEPNPNTGKPFRADPDTRVANNTVHVGGDQASAILLPIVRGEPAATANR